MKVILANPRGFCAGVYMAIDVVDQILTLIPERPIYVYHEIVHNRHVVSRFEDRGVVFVESVDEVPEGATLVFSAHGVSPQIRQTAQDRRLRAIDATCPLVTKVHAEASRYARDGYQVLLIGHNGHDEVVGTIGEAPHAIQVVESADDIPNLEIHDPDRLVYLTQTTLSRHDAQVIIGSLRAAYPSIKDPPSEDICYATTNRQLAVQRLAPECDLVLVVGSQNSSNSQRLAEIAWAEGTPAFLIDDKSEIKQDWFEGVDTLLVTSGASAPEDLVRGLLDMLITRYGAEVQQEDVSLESMEFGLPASLKILMREHGEDPTGRTIRIGSGHDIDSWVVQREQASVPVRMTISSHAAKSGPQPAPDDDSSDCS
ncbi:MAG: 4-hydroxy-3-methylbut-2-enyl diphosphate reductase [Planctomycetes bacterium]|nr:4-hydroxy-3-methylbut-2-enyl diphosphate reductase [Planctomycetota bacterium]NOG55116.1 4-hydroxy-3-methylbut-2-enyl diphosphate reductase [Planctomycetota bacterium]